jgi:hypothetical protein
MLTMLTHTMLGVLESAARSAGPGGDLSRASRRTRQAECQLPVRYLDALVCRCRCLCSGARRRGASARLVLCYASRERKVQRVGLELAVALYFSWLALVRTYASLRGVGVRVRVLPS